MTEAPAVEPLLIHRVIARLNVGGPAIHVVNLTRAMSDGRWRTRLLAGHVSASEGDMAYYAAERGVEVTYLPAMSREIGVVGDVHTLWALYRLFRRERPDVVHTHTAKAGTLGRLAAILARVPIRIHTYHGHVLGGGYFSRLRTGVFLRIERFLGRRTNRLVVLTERQAHEMAVELRVAPRGRFAVVPLGLELGRFADVNRAAAGAAARSELGIGGDELVVGIVGRMVPIKNHELFFEIVCALAERRSALRAVVIGSGEREGELRVVARRLELEERVLWLGWRADLEALYPALDVLLLTSHDEGTPVAVLEAIAAGTSVAARDVGGVAEIIGDAGSGRVVARDATPEDWADAVLEAASGPVPDEEARLRTVARFSVERLAGDLEKLYLAEVAGR